MFKVFNRVKNIYARIALMLAAATIFVILMWYIVLYILPILLVLGLQIITSGLAGFMIYGFSNAFHQEMRQLKMEGTFQAKKIYSNRKDEVHGGHIAIFLYLVALIILYGVPWVFVGFFADFLSSAELWRYYYRFLLWLLSYVDLIYQLLPGTINLGFPPFVVQFSGWIFGLFFAWLSYMYLLFQREYEEKQEDEKKAEEERIQREKMEKWRAEEERKEEIKRKEEERARELERKRIRKKKKEANDPDPWDSGFL